MLLTIYNIKSQGIWHLAYIGNIFLSFVIYTIMFGRSSDDVCCRNDRQFLHPFTGYYYKIPFFICDPGNPFLCWTRSMKGNYPICVLMRTGNMETKWMTIGHIYKSQYCTTCNHINSILCDSLLICQQYISHNMKENTYIITLLQETGGSQNTLRAPFLIFFS